MLVPFDSGQPNSAWYHVWVGAFPEVRYGLYSKQRATAPPSSPHKGNSCTLCARYKNGDQLLRGDRTR